MGWFVGYDGHFLFDNIGDSYIDNKVPYVAFRAMPAIMGSLTVPVVFLTMWESGYSLPASLVAAGLVLFGMSFLKQQCINYLETYMLKSGQQTTLK
jgi:dolichyl-phosphate-mannose-protein mannosyltransferase